MSGGITWKELKDLDLAGIEAAADGWRESSNRASAARDRVDSEMTSKLRDTQEGEAEKAALRRLRRLRDNFQYIYVECGMVRTALDGLAKELKPQQKLLQNALEEAENLKFTVHPDGRVSYPSEGQEVDGKKPAAGSVSGASTFLSEMESDTRAIMDRNPYRVLAQDIADRIAKSLKQAGAVDSEYSNAIQKLKTRPGVDVSDAMWMDAYQDSTATRKAADGYLDREDIPRFYKTEERKEWWDGLSKEDRERFLTLFPEEIGNLNGIPSEVRDAANRTHLPMLMAKLENSDDEQDQAKLQGLEAIQKKLQEGSDPPMYLLGIGDEGNGRAIVSYGNPDTAKNVSTYVPGTGAGLDEAFAGSDLQRAHDTVKAAQKYDPSSASIAWLGYDAPQFPANDFFANLDVMRADKAENGAGELNGFMAGLDTTSQRHDPHLTAIGHSYGSLTVGVAGQREGGIPGADDIVLVGSPGTGADNAEELGVGREHVFVGAAENDLVTKLPTKEEGVGYLFGGFGGYSVGDFISDDDDTWFGANPASEEFGARRFKVEDGPEPILSGGVPAHSNYFDPQKDPTATANIAAIVADRHDLVVEDKPR
ncbi:alpha/beta hydrolase [Streptomyces oceani]|uniref:alpha/beta hydrolase n=1 Tax=Streptomyces oceani TaxID=1075402 RepID=UPI0009A0F8E0|nr:alpha/beta hydrolase [Streptomyces oceani]